MAIKRKEMPVKAMLKMLVEWCRLTKQFKGDYNHWWDKYPRYSLENILDMAEKKLKKPKPKK